MQGAASYTGGAEQSSARQYNFPIEAAAGFLDSSGVSAAAEKVYAAVFNISAIIAAMSIAYNYASSKCYEPLGCGIISLACFLIIQPNAIVSGNGYIAGGLINQDWTAGKGMLGAVICGVLTGMAYCWLMKRIRIEMYPGVSEELSKALSALIPCVKIITVAAIIQGFCMDVFGQSIMELIYSAIEAPIQGVNDSLAGVIIYAFLVSVLCFFGMHSSASMGGLIPPLFTANCLYNQALLDKGVELTVANGGHIVTPQFINEFIMFSGSGVTVGFVLYCVFMAKSPALKTLGRIEAIPALFNINEPILFGLPVIMNPIMVLPFILCPIAIGVTQYAALAVNICPLYSNVIIPWTTPPILSGFLIGGLRTALLQVVCLSESFFIYLPFARRIDEKENMRTYTGERNFVPLRRWDVPNCVRTSGPGHLLLACGQFTLSRSEKRVLRTHFSPICIISPAEPWKLWILFALRREEYSSLLVGKSYGNL